MARVKAAVYTRQRKKKLFRRAKGYVGKKKNVYRVTKERVARGLRHAYVGRKKRKREFRSLWITRINAASRLEGLTYGQFINGLRKANITINRKILSDLAVKDKTSFLALVEKAKENLFSFAKVMVSQ
ncbi:MAG TPA: 50S ribosomal protein L20 [Elusimicrobia bacterium]|jgi:large subunit ribosomal protein L20|nr:50S ribosomal protein L20 [Elusimicrobiota bacterium]